MKLHSTAATLAAFLLAVATPLSVSAQSANDKTIDICEKNTSSSYTSYSTATNVPAGSTLTVKTARYSDFNPYLSGSGTLDLYCGGERSYLGNHSDKSYPDWTNFSGPINIYPYKSVDGSAGFYGVVMLNRGKTFTAEDWQSCIASGKANNMMQNNRVTLANGAAMACEKSAAGVRIGELSTVAGSRIYGYYKSQSAVSSAYYIVGALGTDATLAGRIAPIEKSGTPDLTQAVGIIKEGKGTYTITANDNMLSGGLRVAEGTVLLCNDASAAASKKLSGATGAMKDKSMAVAYVFEGAKLGGTGHVGGTADLYGSIAPGVNGVGTLTIADFQTLTSANLIVHPNAAINCSITDADHYSALEVKGQIIRSTLTQNFSEGTAPSYVNVTLSDDQTVKVGDSFTLVHATKGRENAGVWHLQVNVPKKLTWKVEETTGDDGSYTLTLTCVSLQDDGSNTDDPGINPDDPGDNPGGNDDEVDVSGVEAGLYLRQYLEMYTDKKIGVAVPSTWTYDVPNNPNSSVAKAIHNNFNLCVAENEMKMDAVHPAQNTYSTDAGLALIRYARMKKMDVRGHTLVWHSQVPEWISKDGKSNDKNWTRTQLLDILKDHVTNVVKKFGNNVIEWDVVNETLDDDQSIVRTNPSKYQLRRESVWVKVIGEDFIDSAFVYARRANPNIKLYLNDYGVEYGGAKTQALFNLARRLQQSNIPIDGVGLQCHLDAANFDSLGLDNTIRKYNAIGLNCILTEVDLGIPSTSSYNLRLQAEAYRKITNIFLQNDNCPHMIIWGISDQYSWRNGSNPLLFDGSMQTKPAYYAVQNMMRRGVATDIDAPTASTDAPVTSRSYYALDGRLLTHPVGICIERSLHTDGTVSSRKISIGN